MENIQATLNRKLGGLLDSIDRICNKSVTEENPRWNESFPLPLYSHQRTLIAEMRAREHDLRAGIQIDETSTFYSQFGFLGDPESTGKSWTTLGYITACKRQPAPMRPHKLHYMSRANIFSIEREPTSAQQRNLIIVPSSLLSQWAALFERQEELNYLIIRRRNQLDVDSFLEQLNGLDAVIVPHTLYNALYEKLLPHSYVWTRCFIDDWTSIPLTITRASICAEFTWILTGNWFPFFGENSISNIYVEYLKRISQEELINRHPDLQPLLSYMVQHYLYGGFPSRSLFVQFVNEHPNRDRLVVRTSQSFLKSSLAMIPPRNTLAFYCGDTVTRFLMSMTARGLAPTLERGDFVCALQKVGAQIVTSDEWRSELSSKFRPTLTLDMCPICFEEPKVPTITHCCQNVFCASCLFTSCRSTLSVGCPLCRAQIQASQLVAIHDPPAEALKPFPKKLEVLLRELRARPNGRHIIYFPAENMFPVLRNALRAEGLRFDALKGSHVQIMRKAQQYRDGNINILIVFSRHSLVHVELPQTTTVFIYPDVISEIDKTRIISNCQSIGRTQPLEIVEFLNYEELAEAPAVGPITPAAGPIGAENTSLVESA